MSELNFLLIVGCSILCGINILLAARDLMRYELRSLFAGMLLIYLPINLYGLYMLPFMELRTIHEQKFSYEILNHQYLGFLILNAAVTIMFVIRAGCMQRINLSVQGYIRPKPYLFNLCFGFTVCYSFLFVLLKRSRLFDLIGFIKSGNFSAYYAYRKELIYEKATGNFIINNLDAIFVYGMLYFFVGYFTLIYFRTRKLDWHLPLASGLLILTALLRFQKAPLVIGFCVVLLAWVFSRRINSKMLSSFLKLSFAGGAALALIYIIYSLLGSEGSIFTKLHDRILLSPAFTSYGFYWTFPDHHDHLHYCGSRTLNWIFGFGQKTMLTSDLGTAPLIVSRLYYGTTTFFNFNTSVLGQSYAQNGYWGVAQGTFILFGTFAFLDYMFLKRIPEVLYAPVLIYCFAQFMVVLNAGMLSIFGTGFLVIPIFYILISVRVPRRHRA